MAWKAAGNLRLFSRDTANKSRLLPALLVNSNIHLCSLLYSGRIVSARTAGRPVLVNRVFTNLEITTRISHCKGHIVWGAWATSIFPSLRLGLVVERIG